MAYLKVIFAMFYFCHSENSSSTIKNILVPSLYFLEKNVLVEKYKKQMCYKENNVGLQELIKFRLIKFRLQFN